VFLQCPFVEVACALRTVAAVIVGAVGAVGAVAAVAAGPGLGLGAAGSEACLRTRECGG